MIKSSVLNRLSYGFGLLFVIAAGGVQAQEPAPDMLGAVKNAHIDMVQILEQLEKSGATTISSAFELEEGTLSLTVFIAKPTRYTPPEEASFFKVMGRIKEGKWESKSPVALEDIHQIAAASSQLILLQQSKKPLSAYLKSAIAKYPGSAMVIRPKLKGQKPSVYFVTVDSAGNRVPQQLEF